MSTFINSMFSIDCFCSVLFCLFGWFWFCVCVCVFLFFFGGGFTCTFLFVYFCLFVCLFWGVFDGVVGVDLYFCFVFFFIFCLLSNSKYVFNCLSPYCCLTYFSISHNKFELLLEKISQFRQNEYN